MEIKVKKGGEGESERGGERERENVCVYVRFCFYKKGGSRGMAENIARFTKKL